MTIRNVIESSALSLLAVVSLSAQSGKAPAAARAEAPKAGVIPRAADGHPDLTGLWSNATRTPFERPAVFAGRATISDEEARVWESKENQRWEEGSTIEGGRPVTIQGGAYNVLFYDNGKDMMRIDGQKRTSMIFDPPDGHMPPVLPAARNRPRRASDIPGDYKSQTNDTRCLVGNTPAVPMTPAAYNNNYQIVQSADSILIMLEMIHDVRVVHMNAKHEPSNVRQWFGDSIGHWEGDTLIVETTNFTDQTHYRGSSMDLKVTERFRRVSDRSIEYRATIDDPSTWAKPWSFDLAFRSIPGPIYEYACHEGNYAMVDILGGAAK
ncbi:MAG TPA: hypothetical protein VG273_26320 [Bryobacteraceae bacterium]|jgi:hypothetical protein|nr:hypothetical protein [Bryobacteraceae bacterium]